MKHTIFPSSTLCILTLLLLPPLNIGIDHSLIACTRRSCMVVWSYFTLRYVGVFDLVWMDTKRNHTPSPGRVFRFFLRSSFASIVLIPPPSRCRSRLNRVHLASGRTASHSRSFSPLNPPFACAFVPRFGSKSLSLSLLSVAPSPSPRFLSLCADLFLSRHFCSPYFPPSVGAGRDWFQTKIPTAPTTNSMGNTSKVYFGDKLPGVFVDSGPGNG